MFLIHHIIFEPVRRFFLGIGSLFRWSFFQLLNISIEKKYPTEIDYFLNNKNEAIDKNGFTVAQKNMFVAFVIFIFSLILIEKLES